MWNILTVLGIGKKDVEGNVEDAQEDSTPEPDECHDCIERNQEIELLREENKNNIDRVHD